MRFWDTSALVPLLVDEERSTLVDTWLAEDPEVVVWTLTPVEIASALNRKVRDKELDQAEAGRIEVRLDELMERVHVVNDVEAAKGLARRLLRVHPLRAADAMPLAAALLSVAGRPSRVLFHTFDRRLARAALQEGFSAELDP